MFPFPPFQKCLIEAGYSTGKARCCAGAFPSPLVGEGGSARSAEPDEGCWKKLGLKKASNLK
jgi:hypothetical protein